MIPVIDRVARDKLARVLREYGTAGVTVGNLGRDVRRVISGVIDEAHGNAIEHDREDKFDKTVELVGRFVCRHFCGSKFSGFDLGENRELYFQLIYLLESDLRLEEDGQKIWSGWQVIGAGWIILFFLIFSNIEMNAALFGLFIVFLVTPACCMMRGWKDAMRDDLDSWIHAFGVIRMVDQVNDETIGKKNEMPEIFKKTENKSLESEKTRPSKNFKALFFKPHTWSWRYGLWTKELVDQFGYTLYFVWHLLAAPLCLLMVVFVWGPLLALAIALLAFSFVNFLFEGVVYIVSPRPKYFVKVMGGGRSIG